MDDATDEKRDKRPQPRDTEGDRQVLPKGPVHRDGLAERDSTRSWSARSSPTLIDVRRRGFGSLAWASAQELFDQRTAFGRLALVHVIMMAGDTLVTVSLAGSLFFSVSPTEAKSRVLALSTLDDRTLRRRVAAAGSVDRQVGQRPTPPRGDVGARARGAVLDDEPTPQLALALPVGLPGVDLLEALRGHARSAGARDGSHRPAPRALRPRRPGGLADDGGPTGEGLLRFQRATDVARHAQRPHRRFDRCRHLEGSRRDQCARDGVVRVHLGDGGEFSSAAPRQGRARRSRRAHAGRTRPQRAESDG